jgi:transporter family-2 protein
LLLFARGGEKIKDWRSLPWYMLGAGIFGLILYQTINFTLPRLGGTAMITLIIVGQLLTGVVIDHFGLLGVAVRPVDLTRAIGVIVLLGGGYLIIK